MRDDASWIARIGVERPVAVDPVVREGEFLVGGAIQSNSPRLKVLLDAYPKVLVVEMEGIGAGRAVADSSLATQPPEYLAVRGVSDFCNVDAEHNQRTGDVWRDYAAAAAAAHAYAIVMEADDWHAGPRNSADVKSDSSPLLQSDEQAGPAARTGAPSMTSRHPVWSVPYLRNQNFLGREKQLQEIRTALTSSGTRQSIQALVGLGGVGKTHVAIEYADRYASEYQAVLWVQADSLPVLASGYADLARILDLPDQNVNDHDQRQQPSG